MSRYVLQQAAKEAVVRGASLQIVHVVDVIDQDSSEANRAGVSDSVKQALRDDGLDQVDWDLHLVTGSPDVASAILAEVGQIKPDLLVIGARRRSPVGKALLGSVAQSLVLEAEVPVLVVKSPK